MKVYVVFAKGYDTPYVNNFTGVVLTDKQEALKWLPEHDVVVAEADAGGYDDWEYLEENEA